MTKASPLFVEFPVNDQGRDFAVGDIHGHKKLLDKALKSVEFDKKLDRLFAVGDLIDRGPDGAELLRMVEREPWFFSVRGNHEQMLIEAQCNWKVKLQWGRYGNEWTKTIRPDELSRLAGIAARLPLAIEVPLPDGRRVGLIHAEVRFGRSWQHVRQMQPGSSADLLVIEGRTDHSAALWGRSRFLRAAEIERGPSNMDDGVEGIDQVICGHSVVSGARPIMAGNIFFIETGAFLSGGRLTLTLLGSNVTSEAFCVEAFRK